MTVSNHSLHMEELSPKFQLGNQLC